MQFLPCIFYILLHEKVSLKGITVNIKGTNLYYQHKIVGILNDHLSDILLYNLYAQII